MLPQGIIKEKQSGKQIKKTKKAKPNFLNNGIQLIDGAFHLNIISL